MARFIGLTVLVIALTSFSTTTQADVIALYGDTLRTDCNIDFSEDVAIFYIFHYSTAGASMCQFRIPRVSCMDFGGILGPTMWQPAYPYTGDIETGIAFDYGACLTGWIYLAVGTYWDMIGLTGGLCCEQTVLEHPGASTGQPEAFDCQGQPSVALGLSGFITDEPVCTCDVPTAIPDQPHTTWGAIKALYADEGGTP
jgi:hypothetical protein